MKRNMLIILSFVALALLFWFVSCNSSPSTQTSEGKQDLGFEKPRVPDWHKNATIYEVNLRHFTPEGTFNAFATHLPRLKEMGVDILWFMPIHPVSVEKRKGELGSPYAVADYKGVNPDFGTMEDFKALVNAIHEAGMYCIIDWVPNHTGWDNPWITEHPEWYTQDKDGNIIDPIDYNTGEPWGWTDVADLNFDVPEMRLGMIDAMAFWITEVGIDGFRADVAHGVPVDFWAQCSDSLYQLEPMFMLAEAEVPAIRNNGAFVMDYGWEMHHLLNDIAKTQGANQDAGGKLVKGNLVEGSEEKIEPKNALDIDKMLAKKAEDYSSGYAMHFTSNHDENSWAGTEFVRMGEGHQTFAVLTATFDGMPLIYTGQESAMDKRLEFFKKDEVPWGDYVYAGFYKTLFDLKHRNQALWNGTHGGALVKLPTGADEAIYAFTREKNGDRVIVILNLSALPQVAEINATGLEGSYTEVFTQEQNELGNAMTLSLNPWEYQVYSNK